MWNLPTIQSRHVPQDAKSEASDEPERRQHSRWFSHDLQMDLNTSYIYIHQMVIYMEFGLYIHFAIWNPIWIIYIYPFAIWNHYI